MIRPNKGNVFAGEMVPTFWRIFLSKNFLLNMTYRMVINISPSHFPAFLVSAIACSETQNLPDFGQGDLHALLQNCMSSVRQWATIPAAHEIHE
jgi:hypothetical protein